MMPTTINVTERQRILNKRRRHRANLGCIGSIFIAESLI